MRLNTGKVCINGRDLTVEHGKLKDFLPDIPLDWPIALDCESSGLYVDGEWSNTQGKCQPPARVSVVSLAWQKRDGGITSVAIPFDQGWLPGKPGLWDYTTNSFKRLEPMCSQCSKPKNNRCHTTNKSKHEYTPASTEDINMSVDDAQQLFEWLAGRKLVFHNAKYDTHIMRAGLRTHPEIRIDLEESIHWDTLLWQGLTEPTSSNALKEVAKYLWGYEEEEESLALKEALKKNGTGLTKRYDLVDWSVIGPYAAKDSELTIRLYHKQMNEIESGNVDPNDLSIIRTELDLCKLLFKMECRGIEFDAEGMAREAQDMARMVSSLESSLPFSPPTITEAKKYFYETLGKLPYKVTANGAPSLDKECVGRLVADDVPGAELWQRIANIESAINKWYRRWPHLIGPDGRLRTNFRQMRMESDRSDKKSGGAISGRLSAERVQAQGVPHEYRIPKGIRSVKSFFKARVGTQLWEIDASNCEIRVAAWASRCKALAARINTGANVHDENTKAIFGVEQDHPNWDEFRLLAKIGVFSDLYGSGVRTMQAQFEAGLKRAFPEGKVREFKNSLAAAYPELKTTAKACQRKADKMQGGCGYVRLVNGRRRVFGWGERTHKAFNSVIQGGVAETMKLWMLEVESLFPGALLSQVHDSIWVEVPAEDYESHLNAKNEVVYDTFPSTIDAMKKLGVEIFESKFSLPSNPIMFSFDAKRIA